MKLVTTTNEVESANTGASSGFTFAAGAKAFRIFIDGIYSDKIRAIVRELMTNAYDAHLAVGTIDKPFNVYLPTLINPTFGVRDFGPAISHEDMMARFTCVFDSTKDSSNDFVGALGLGRLSPFAYTDTFSVTTYIDKVARAYSVYMNEQNIPTLTLLGENETDEVNGFEVQVPVSNGDMTAFWNAYKFTLLGFDVAPAVVNTDGVEVYETAMTGNGWKIVKNLDGIYAKQGCVVYPIDTSKVKAGEIVRDSNGIIVDYPIGQLEFNASREALGYREATINNLNAGLKTAEGEIIKDIGEQFSRCKNIVEAAKLSDNLKLFSAEFLQKVEWKGNSVKSLSREIYNKNGVNICYATMKTPNTRRFPFVFNDKSVKVLYNDLKDVFIFKKGEKAVSTRICEYFEEKNSQSPGGYVYSRTFLVAMYEDMRGLMKLQRYFPGINLVDVASLPMPIRKYVSGPSKATGKRGFIMVDVLKRDRKFGGYETENNVVVEWTKPGIYALRSFGTYSYPISYKVNFTDALKHLESLGVDTSMFENIPAITESKAEKFKKAGWISLAEALEKVLETLKDNEKLHEGIWYIKNRYVSTSFLNNMDVEYSFLKKLDQSHPLNLLREKEKEFKILKEKYSNISSALNLLTRVVDETENRYKETNNEFLMEIRGLNETVLNMYPMLKLLDLDTLTNNEDGTQILLDYLNGLGYDNQTEAKEAA